jgi:hypothetical protein
MANTIARAWGYDSSRVKEAHRLGSKAAKAEAATWKTHAIAYVNADGSGYVEVSRVGRALFRYDFTAEDADDEPGDRG